MASPTGLQQQAMLQQAMVRHQSAQQAMYNSGLSTQTATAGGLGSLYTSTTGTTNVYVAMTTGTQATTTTVPIWPNGNRALGGVGYPPVAVFDDPSSPPYYNIVDGKPIMLRMPDGTTIDVKTDGSFTIEDKDAKVIYRANRMRDFNSFINASDKLESFIKFCGELGVRQGEMLDIPVKHFIAWLIVEAALADGEKPEEIATLPDLREHVLPRCTGCGRFIRRKLVARKITFCRPVCLERELAA